jgi:hypothetical protein
MMAGQSFIIYQSPFTQLMADNRITITIPAQSRWLHYAEGSLNHYSDTVGFSEILKEMVTHSVNEALEELFKRAESACVSDTVNLRLDFLEGAVVVDMAYSARIPLNPLEAEDYEVPDAGVNLDNVNIDKLWLHIIKQRMDRLRFIVRGSRHILRMIKYGREAGEEKYPWIMAIKPALRKDLYLYLDDPDMPYPSSTLQAPGIGALKLGASETFIVRHMDGIASFSDIFMAHVDALGLPSPSVMAGLYEKLEEMNMLAQPEDKTFINKAKQLLTKIINPDFSIPRADRIVTALYGKTRFLYNPVGLTALLTIGLSGFVPLSQHIHRFREVFAGMEKHIADEPLIILYIYILNIIHVALHELGHGITCKHYGGKVSRIGIMFYLAFFVFYCDTTSAWNFQDSRRRIMVALGGPIVTFAVFGAVFWTAGFWAGSGYIWEYVFVMFGVFVFFELVMNMNPFIEMDAYYVLMDYTGINNLRKRAFSFIKHQFLGYLGFASHDDVEVKLDERRIFWWYGIIGSLVTIFFIIIPVYRLAHMLFFESVSGGKLFFIVFIAGLLTARFIFFAFQRVRAVCCHSYKIQ